jgi:hypothetical protein
MAPGPQGARWSRVLRRGQGAMPLAVRSSEGFGVLLDPDLRNAGDMADYD